MLASKIYKAYKTNTDPFPKNDIPTLLELSIQVVADNFALYPHLPGVRPDIKDQIVAKTSTKLDVQISAAHIENQSYWRAAAQSTFKNCKPQNHGNSWKQAFLQSYIQNKLMNFKQDGNINVLRSQLQSARYYIFSLNLHQLRSHLDFSVVFHHLPSLSVLKLTYGAKHVGMQYERSLFGMKMIDAEIFSECIRATTSLVHLGLPCNMIDDDLIRILVNGLMLNKTITQLDLSHNRISDAGSRRIAKYLLSTELLTHLDLSDNLIHYQGSRYLGQALKKNESLLYLNLKMNRLDDKAGAKLCMDLANSNNTIQVINFSCNSLGHMFCEKLSELLLVSKSLKQLDLSCNFIADEDCSTLKTSLTENERIIKLDCRNNTLNKENEKEIHQIVTKNFLKQKGIPFVKRERIPIQQSTIAPPPEEQAAGSSSGGGGAAAAPQQTITQQPPAAPQAVAAQTTSGSAAAAPS